MKNIIEKIINIFKKKEKEESDKEIIKATKYGFFNDFIYAIRICLKYNWFYLFSMAAFSMTKAVFEILGSFMPKIILDLIDKSVAVEKLVIVVACVGMIMTLLNLIKDYFSNQSWYNFDKIEYFIKGDYLRKVFKTDYKNMENPLFLDLTERARAATYYGRGFNGYCNRLSEVTYSVLVVIIAGAAIAFVNPIIIVVTSIISFITYRMLDNTMEWSKESFRDVMAGNNRKHYYFASVTRDFTYAKDIRLFGIDKLINIIWDDLNVIYFAACKKNHDKWIACEAKMSSVRLLQNIMIYSVLVYMVLQRSMSISNFVLYIGLTASFATSITDLFSLLVWINMNQLQMDDFRTLMDWKEEEPDITNNEGVLTDINLGKYEFTFDNVSFKYPGHDKYVLKNINLTIKAGMKLAIVGANGAGKTTLTKLIMRLYEPTDGQILLNGRNIKEYDRREYQKIFAPVFQDIEIFAFPIWENVSMKKREVTDFDKVIYDLERSGLNKKVNEYDKGIETALLKIFDENGIDLSGGERQRLAMARALYQNRNVLVLDEPTAALDALAEEKMYQEFKSMTEGKTSLFISHRLSSTRFCDEIILFDDGKIAEQGSHDELMAKGEKYFRLYELQSQYYKEGMENA